MTSNTAAPPPETKTFRLKLDVLEDDGTIEGYGSVFGNRDSYGDVVVKGAFTRSIDRTGGTIPLLWQHDPAQPIGATTEMTEDDHGLRFRGRINLDTQRGREAYSLLRQGAIRGVSIGFNTVQDTVEEGVRKLRELKLWELSVVTFPANDLAQVTAVKAVTDDGTLERVAQWADTEHKAGRVLSAQNLALVEAAISALQALHSAALRPDPEDGDEDAGEMAAGGPAESRQDPPMALLALHTLRDTYKKEALS